MSLSATATSLRIPVALTILVSSGTVREPDEVRDAKRMRNELTSDLQLVDEDRGKSLDKRAIKLLLVIVPDTANMAGCRF